MFFTFTRVELSGDHVGRTKNYKTKKSYFKEAETVSSCFYYLQSRLIIILIIIIIWGVRTKIIPVIVGALGSTPLRLNDNLGIPVELIQRCALLGPARILRKVQKM